MGPSSYAGNGRRQIAQINWLGDVFLEAGLQRLANVFQLGKPRQRNGRKCVR